jgi:hypothetical protein
VKLYYHIVVEQDKNGSAVGALLPRPEGRGLSRIFGHCRGKAGMPAELAATALQERAMPGKMLARREDLQSLADLG